jgi:hypothetical protein
MKETPFKEQTHCESGGFFRIYLLCKDLQRPGHRAPPQVLTPQALTTIKNKLQNIPSQGLTAASYLV